MININQGFAQGSSWVHQLDPRIKIITIFLLATVLAVGESIVMLLQALVFSSFLILSAKLDLKEVGKRLMVVNFFILGIWLFVPLTYPGEALFQVGPLSFSIPGVIYATKITLRSNAIMLGIIALLSTSTVSSLMQAMRYLYIPEKIVYLFFFVYRYVHVIWKEFNRLHDSMLMRGFKSETSLHSYRSYAYLIGMLIIRSYDRSRRVYEAMLCRGFRGEFHNLDELSFSSRDLKIFSGILFFISWIIIVEKGVFLV
ncbi:cobalt ECF transporter T component CbiQ [Natroniella sulfidigena]|uniref:cobalt ECF transporter T component CbiQ n=1 Tax=Natroniella sulfidigena TaxID=723921 RepID=UPI00200A9224|nr:cobalt ECF transporter T component CbiQ [Natroniella sulfidigena]MCK8817362.1 cobalt ECF transporter T component CbiQ [Natroniella sulfidigena]